MRVSDSPHINMIRGDCMEAMAGMEDNAYELAIVDPPYGVGNFNSEYHTNENGERIKNNSNFSIDYDWNEDTPENKYFSELYRVSKDRIIWGANYYNCFDNGAVVWYKGDQTKTISHCEIASLSKQQKVDYVHIDWQAGFYRKITEGIQIHPCQKPVKLYKWLLKNYANEGDRILDTHGGSGSIAIACYDMGFDLDWYELDKDYYAGAVDRFKEHKKQGQLFRPEKQKPQPKQGELI